MIMTYDDDGLQKQFVLKDNRFKTREDGRSE